MPDFTFAHREEGFDNHIDMSIRNYSTLIDDVVEMSRYFVEDGSRVYDLGCSTGKMLARMVETNKEFSPDVEYIGLENADGFLGDMKKTMESVDSGNLSLVNGDVRSCDYSNASLITSIFTLQFIPRKDRCELLRRVYLGLNPGGAFIFGEKTYASCPKAQDMLTFLYYDHKRKSFSEEDIMNKEKTLRSMLKPNTWEELSVMLHDSGFDKIQTFWQNHLFVAAVCIK
jgi:tRNA (cmo5U34)-methyltransferase